MTDLTTITDPFGTLPRTTQMELLAAHYLDHRVIQVLMTMRNKFEDIAHPNWIGGTVYRVRPEAVTPDSINWDHVAPAWMALTRDEDGTPWLHVRSEPELTDHCWTSSNYLRADTHASYIRGTCDWKDSLVLRPVQS